MARKTHRRKRAAIVSGDGLAVLLLVALICLGGWFWRKTSAAGTSSVAVQKTAAHAAASITNPPVEVHVVPPPPVVASPPPASNTVAEAARQTNSVSGKPTNAPAYTREALLKAQVALDRMAISPGSIDGLMGSQTRSALATFQARNGLAITSDLDAATAASLNLSNAPLSKYVVTLADLACLSTIPQTWLGKSEQTALGYESLLELLSERSHSHPSLIRRLNPTVLWTNVPPYQEVTLPSVDRVRPAAKAAVVRIQLAARNLQVFDAEGRLLAHFPCSIARRVEKRPLGEMRIMAVAPNPNYTFDPDVFPESEEGRLLGRKLILPPGPNNPVGTVWIGLDRPGYGIHGTPRPEEVGRTESHGCFRLANWNAEYLLTLVSVGTPVLVEP